MRDMTALTMLVDEGVDEAGDPKYAMFTQGIMPSEGLEDRSKEDQTPYDVWEREGYIITTPGKMVRLDFLAKMLVDWCSDFDTVGIAYDQWLFQRFALELDSLGAELPVLEHPQGFSRRKSSPLFMPDSN